MDKFRQYLPVLPQYQTILFHFVTQSSYLLGECIIDYLESELPVTLTWDEVAPPLGIFSCMPVPKKKNKQQKNSEEEKVLKRKGIGGKKGI